MAFGRELLHQIFQQLVHLFRRHAASFSSICCIWSSGKSWPLSSAS
jgi:hypothetical protein